MRSILTGWLIQVHSRFCAPPEILSLCINSIGPFLSTHVDSLVKLQPVGITCMFIAVKVKEIISPSAQNLLYCVDNSSCSEIEILQAEHYVLETLGWNLSYPNPIHFHSCTDPSYSKTESSRSGVATSTHWVGTSAISIPPTSSTVLTPLTPNSRLSVAPSTR